MANATSLFRITVLRFYGDCEHLDAAWSEEILPRVLGTDVLIFDLPNATRAHPSALGRLIGRCLDELPGTAVRVSCDLPVQWPGKLANVIWEEIELAPEPDLRRKDDESAILRLAR